MEGQTRSKKKNSHSSTKAVTRERAIELFLYDPVTVNRKQINLGYYTKAEHAAEAYNVAAKKYFGEFALLNKL